MVVRIGCAVTPLELIFILIEFWTLQKALLASFLFGIANWNTHEKFSLLQVSFYHHSVVRFDKIKRGKRKEEKKKKRKKNRIEKERRRGEKE